MYFPGVSRLSTFPGVFITTDCLPKTAGTFHFLNRRNKRLQIKQSLVYEAGQACEWPFRLSVIDTAHCYMLLDLIYMFAWANANRMTPSKITLKIWQIVEPIPTEYFLVQCFFFFNSITFLHKYHRGILFKIFRNRKSDWKGIS